MAKPGAMIYWEVFDTLDRMKPEKVKLLLTAIRNLAQRGESPDFGNDEALNLVWPMIQQRIRNDAERYEAIREARAEAGRKGGNSRAENAKQTQANEANATFAKQTQASQANNNNNNNNNNYNYNSNYNNNVNQ